MQSDVVVVYFPRSTSLSHRPWPLEISDGDRKLHGDIKIQSINFCIKTPERHRGTAVQNHEISKNDSDRLGMLFFFFFGP